MNWKGNTISKGSWSKTARRGSSTAALYSRAQFVHDRYADIGGIRTRFRAAGSSGPALVLIHGLGATLESWMHNIEPLGRCYRVLAPDLVWFGKTDKPAGEVKPERFSEFIVQFMDRFGLRRAILIGNSMGGMIAVRIALDYPDRVSGLVLVNPAGFGREMNFWLRLRTILRLRSRVRVPLRIARWAVRQLVYNRQAITDELIESVLEATNLPGSQEAYYRVLRLGADWRGLKAEALRQVRDAAPGIRVPTLIVWGRQDRILPVSHAFVAHRQIPNSQLYIFDHCGHCPMIERADEFNRLVDDFVKNHVVTDTGSDLAA